MVAAPSRSSASQLKEALRPRVEPAVQAAGGPFEPLITPDHARPVDLNILPITRLADQALLKPEAAPGRIEQLCDEALGFHSLAVCAHPCFAGRVAARRSGSDVAPSGAVGFPFGANPTSVRVYEALQAIAGSATRPGTSAGVNIARQTLGQSVMSLSAGY